MSLSKEELLLELRKIEIEERKLKEEINDKEEGELLDLLEEEIYNLSEQSFYTFFKNAWENGIDSDEYVDNWHIECICEHAQAVVEGKISNLLVNIPPRHCLEENTYILLEDGSPVKIKDIDIGASVLSYNLDKDEISTDVIKNKFYQGKQLVYRLTFSNLDTLLLTENHKLYVYGKGWQRVKDIERGDYFFNGYEHLVFLVSQELVGERETWDIETEKYNCFFATEQNNKRGVLSHNSKSKILSIALPIWTFIKRPYEKFVIASHSDRLVTQFIVNARNLVNSEWYSKRWIGENKSYTLAKDSNTKTRIDNNVGGQILGITPQGTNMGFGFSLAVLDDCLDGEDAHSPTMIEKVNRWYSGTLLNRANKELARKIIVMQRLKEDDLAGYVMSGNEDYFRLNIPAEYEKKFTFFSPLGEAYNDPRKKEGELITPNRFSAKFYEPHKKDPYSWAAKYQQRPAPIEGGLIKREWLRTYFARPLYFDMVAMAFDLAMTKADTSDNSAGVVVAKKDSRYYVLDCVAGKMDIMEQVEMISTLIQKYPDARSRLIENKANGEAVMSMLRSRFSGIISMEPKEYGGNKEARLISTIPEFASNSVYFPPEEHYPWMADLTSELLLFPKAAHDDIVDALVYAIAYLSIHGRMLSMPVNPFGVSDQQAQEVKDNNPFKLFDSEVMSGSSAAVRGYFN